MEGFTIVDTIAAVVVVVSALLAYARGFVRESLSIAGWIVAAVAAYYLAPAAQPYVAQIPYLDRFLTDSCELGLLASFVAVFAGGLVVMAIITPAFASAVQNSALGGLDRGAGFLFGAARGVLLVAIAFIIYERAMPEANIAMMDDSRSAAIFMTIQGEVDEALPDEAPGWLARRYEELVAHCAPPQGAGGAPAGD